GRGVPAFTMARSLHEVALLAALALAPACVVTGDPTGTDESGPGEAVDDSSSQPGGQACDRTDDPDDPSCCPDGEPEESVDAYYVAASVFAAGECNFNNCAKDGWSVDTPAGDVEVRCNFSNCLKEGWVAEFPDGDRARTSCSFSDCFKEGWR